MLTRSRPIRSRVVERAILITTVSRDMEACVEHFSLYNSATSVLEKNSEAYSTIEHKIPAHILAKNITDMWCAVEAVRSPFTKSDLRKAIADAMRLAKKELAKEDAETIREIEDLLYDVRLGGSIKEEGVGKTIGIEKADKWCAKVEEYIIDGTYDHQLPEALQQLEEDDIAAHDCLIEMIPDLGELQHA